MRSDTLEALERNFSEFPFLKGGAVPRGEIEQAATALGVTFPPDYVEFVEKFGGGIVGPYPIFGLRKVDVMGRAISVVSVTKDFREQDWRGTEDWIIVSEDHATNPIGLAPDGKVWISDHDFGQVTVAADSFENYIRRKCLKMPN